MQQFGDDDSGFTVTVDNQVVRLIGWGFWEPVLAARLTPAVVEACRKAGRVTELDFDGARLRPQGDGGQEAIATLLGKTRQLGIAAIVIGVSSALTKMQLMRIVKEAGVKDIVQYAGPTVVEGK